MGSAVVAACLIVASIDSITNVCSACNSEPSCRPRVSPYAMKENFVTPAVVRSAGRGDFGAVIAVTTLSDAGTACPQAVAGASDASAAAMRCRFTDEMSFMLQHREGVVRRGA